MPVTVPMNDLGRAYQAEKAAIDAAVAAVLDSGWYVHGDQHRTFEAEFAAYLGLPHCVGVANGTDALELALRCIDTGDPARRHVVTAANAGGYTSVATLRAGLLPRYADVDVATHCLSAATVAPVLGEDVAAIVVTHLYGRLADMDGVVALAADHGIPLIEDCAQAVGAARGGTFAGGFGDLGTFSFYPTKNLGALGDGGAIVAADPDRAATLRRLRQYGWSDKYTIARDGGRNSRLDEVQAAVLRVRLAGVDRGNARRRAIIARYVEAASGTRVRVLTADGPQHAGHLAVAITEDRDTVRDALEKAGVRTDIHYPVPDHHQQGITTDRVTLPVTEALATQVLSLPCFPELTEAEVAVVCSALARL